MGWVIIDKKRFDNMSFVISKRDPGLADLSDKALEQLTKTLYLDSTMYFGDQARKWIIKQETRIRDLDPTLLRPKDLLSRLAISMAKHKLPFFQGRANLCVAHKTLDPRIIRNLLVLIADECTIHTNRYRGLRLRAELPLSLDGWVERLDFLTALWIGEDRYERIFKRRLGTPVPECAQSGCEACMLAVVGGSAVYLTDLRASLIARRTYIRKRTRREAREPRLLRIVELWISFYQDNCRRVVQFCSESIVEDIVKMRTKVRRRRDREVGRCFRKGRFPPPEEHLVVRLTEDGLPMPRQPHVRGGNGRHQHGASLRGKMVEMSGALSFPAGRQDARIQQIPDEYDGVRGLGLVKLGSLSLSGLVDEREDESPLLVENHFLDEAELAEDDVVNEGEEEYWVQDYRNLILRGGDPPNEVSSSMGASASKGVDAHTGSSQLRVDTQSDDLWTSRIEDESDVESPREVTLPSLRADSNSEIETSESIVPPTPSRPRPLSSFYSQDYQITRPPTRRGMGGGTMIALDQTISMLSAMQRGSAMPLPLDIVMVDGKGGREAALAKLEGRDSITGDDNVASCFATMGWGGPKRQKERNG